MSNPSPMTPGQTAYSAYHQIFDDNSEGNENAPPLTWKELGEYDPVYQEEWETFAQHVAQAAISTDPVRQKLVELGEEEEQIHLKLHDTRNKQEEFFESIKEQYPENYRLFREARETHHERLLEIRRERRFALAQAQGEKEKCRNPDCVNGKLGHTIVNGANFHHIIDCPTCKGTGEKP